VYKRELDRVVKQAEEARDRKSPLSEEEKQALLAAERTQRVDEFRERFANPYVAAERGYVDAVIAPRETRRRLISALSMLDTKRDKNPPKKHGNIPL
jgi:propionyl-CoA carboxylase beta chain